MIYQRNSDKWKAAVTFCRNKKWKFAVWTQKGINVMD